MLVSDLFERYLSLRGRGGVQLFENLDRKALIALLDFSKAKRVRGLLLEDGTVLWWDSYDATHGDVATVYDPSYNDLSSLFEYKKHRLELCLEEKKLHLFSGASAEALAANPHTAFLISPRIQHTVTAKNFS